MDPDGVDLSAWVRLERSVTNGSEVRMNFQPRGEHGGKGEEEQGEQPLREVMPGVVASR